MHFDALKKSRFYISQKTELDKNKLKVVLFCSLLFNICPK
jgi:hypothetical protein